ncbi:hypothetical protein [Novosphingobium terrae]|uniref:hypothetical protein n=1 Tax=Novosphingobium terrae TaxID=2726189 RepID=UPI00197FE2CB|nr:hypothetical protein [Novosphingobium terrae]
MTTAVLAPSHTSEKPLRSKILTLGAPVAAMVYPAPLVAFHAMLTAADGSSEARWWLIGPCLAMLLTLAFAAPTFAWQCATYLSQIEDPSIAEVRARRVAYLSVGAPALFSFIGTTTFMLGIPRADIWILGLFWAALALFVGTGANTPYVSKASPSSPYAMRVTHGVAALVLVLGFIGLHLTNHLTGLIGPDVHRSIMKALRHIYRAPVVEPLLMVGFIVLIVTGCCMAWKLSGKAGDRFRAFQLATGIYLTFFLISHTSAVFVLARTYLGIDSDWGFATGAPAGLLHDSWNIRLVPLYGLGVFCAVAHPFAGARVVMLAHGVRRTVGDAIVVWSAVASVMISLAIMLGMCGLRLYFV